MTNIFQKQKIKADLLAMLYDSLAEKEKYTTTNYKKTGEQEQAYDYDNHCPKVDEEGNPVMRDVWDYVPIPEDELSDEQRLIVDVIHELEKSLEKLL